MEFDIFSDYYQIYLRDRDSTVELADRWTPDNPLHPHLALAEDAVAVLTGVNGYVTVAFAVTNAPPAPIGPAGGYLECSLRVDSGELVLTTPTYGEEDGDRVAVPAGWLRLRISLSESAPVLMEARDGRPQRVHVRCWPAPPGPPLAIVDDESPDRL